MRFIRFIDKNSDKPVEMKGITNGTAVFRVYGSFFKNYAVDGSAFTHGRIELLPPVLPATIMCTAPAYAKSPASLAGNGAHVKIPGGHEHIYCLPRAAFVLKDLSNNPNGAAALFGVSMMLDFFTDSGNPAATASFNGHTVLGPSVNTEIGGKTVFHINGQVISEAIISQNEYAKVFDKLSPNMRFHTGDIVALPLAEAPHKCVRDDIINLARGEESLTAAVI